MNRFKLIPVDRALIQERLAFLRSFIPLFTHNSFDSLLPPVALLKMGLDCLFAGDQDLKTALKNAEGFHLQALEKLKEGVVLGRGDEKKWPDLSLKQRALRLIDSYLPSSSNRFLFEKAFRGFYAFFHLYRAEENLQSDFLSSAHEEMLQAQEELRHVLALSVGIDLVDFQEEVETSAQKTGLAEREVMFDLFDQHLSSDQNIDATIEQKTESLIQKYELSEVFHLSFLSSFRVPQAGPIDSESALMDVLRSHPQNLVVSLQEGVSFDFRKIIKSLLMLPDPRAMPTFKCLISIVSRM